MKYGLQIDFEVAISYLLSYLVSVNSKIWSQMCNIISTLETYRQVGYKFHRPVGFHAQWESETICKHKSLQLNYLVGLLSYVWIKGKIDKGMNYKGKFILFLFGRERRKEGNEFIREKFPLAPNNSFPSKMEREGGYMENVYICIFALLVFPFYKFLFILYGHVSNFN